MEQIILSNGQIEMGVMPKLGAALSFFKYKHNNEFRDVMRPYEETPKGHDSNNASMFVMMPYCSRIRGGSFVYWGITRKVSKNQQGIADPIHGDGWKSEWEVVSQTDTRLELKLLHDKDKGGFPFSYEGTIIYELIENRFQITLSVKNLNQLPMPCGLGIHPFFVKTKEVELDFSTQVVWSNEADPIFDKPYMTPDAWQFTGGKALKNAVFDTCFGGYNGQSSILYPDLGLSISLESDEQFNHLILYAPRGKNFFCLEPVSNASNAFNLAANGVIGTGMKSIGPDQTMTGSISMTFRG